MYKDGSITTGKQLFRRGGVHKDLLVETIDGRDDVTAAVISVTLSDEVGRY